MQQILEAMQQPPNSSLPRTPSYKCEKCKDLGTFWDDDGQPHECQCSIEAKSQNERMKSTEMLKSTYSKYRFEDFEAVEDWQKKMFDKCKEFVNTKGVIVSLVLAGQSGCGKTLLAAPVFNEFMRRGAKCECVSYVEFMRELSQNLYNRQEFRDVMQRIKRCDMLLIDDLFRDIHHKPKSADLSLMFEIIDYRYRNNLPVIVTTNLLVSELANIDETIAGRLVEMAKRDNKNFLIQIKNDTSRNYRLRGVFEI